MKKVILNEDRCIGCGACMSVAPDNFTFNDEGRAAIISEELTETAIEASEMCPVNAITIENSECTCSNECACTEENNCGCMNDCSCDDNCTCGDSCTCGDNCNCNE